MTVKELIASLQTRDPDSLVWFFDCEMNLPEPVVGILDGADVPKCSDGPKDTDVVVTNGEASDV